MLDCDDYRRKSDVAQLLQRLGAAGARPDDPVLSLYAEVVESMDDDGLVPSGLAAELDLHAVERRDSWLALEEAGVIRRYAGAPSPSVQVVHFYLFTEPPVAPQSRVYFIASGDGGPVKIGRSRRPSNRSADLQTGNPERLRVLAHLPGDSTMEGVLHDAFRPWKIHGEWFRRNPRLMRLIDELRSP